MKRRGFLATALGAVLCPWKAGIPATKDTDIVPCDWRTERVRWGSDRYSVELAEALEDHLFGDPHHDASGSGIGIDYWIKKQ